MILLESLCLKTFRYFLYISNLSGCKVIIKVENGGHFGRHLGFWRKLQGDSWGLLVCYFTHIPGHVLKYSACYEIFPGYNQCSWTIGCPSLANHCTVLCSTRDVI